MAVDGPSGECLPAILGMIAAAHEACQGPPNFPAVSSGNVPGCGSPMASLHLTRLGRRDRERHGGIDPVEEGRHR